MGTLLGRRARLVVEAGLLAAVVASCTPRAHDSETAAWHRALAEWLAGDESAVPASPELCAIDAAKRGRPAETSMQRPETGWYWQRGDCTVSYALDPRAVIALAGPSWLRPTAETPSDGVDPDRVARASELVRSLATALERERPAPIHRLEIQTLLWELDAGLTSAARVAGASPPAGLAALEHDIERAIARTLLSGAELDSLPSTLRRVGAANAEARALVERIERQDPTILEVRVTRRGHRSLHEQLLADRFGSRIFVLAPAVREEALLRHLGRSTLVSLNGLERKFPDLRPSHDLDDQAWLALTRFAVPEVRAVQVLYFRAIDSHWRVRTTPVVAAWREMTVPGSLTVGVQATLDVLARTEIHDIEYVRGFGDAVARYAERDARAPFFGLLAATRVPPGRFVTTRRAQCASCHGGHLKVFGPFNWVAGQQPHYELTPPLAVSMDDESRSWEQGRVVSSL